MADFASSGWPAGASVSVYADPGRPGAAPSSSAVAGPFTASAAGVASLTGLEANKRYVASDGSRTVSFTTDNRSYPVFWDDEGLFTNGSGGRLEVPIESSDGQSLDDITADTADLATATARLLLQAGRAPAMARVLDKFLTTPNGVGVGRSGTTYSLYRGVGPGLFSKFDLVLDSAEPGDALHQLQGLSVIAPMLSKAYNDASVASSGTFTASANAGYYGGSAHYSTASPASKTFTSPAGVTSVGVRVPLLTNGGRFFKVSIDGDATLADGVLTAAEAVTANLLDSTALVANGGTLNPTDRVFDTYASSVGAQVLDKKIGLAAGLTAGVHTVVLADSGYNRKGTTSQRAYISGFSYSTATSTPADANTVPVSIGVLNGLVSAWEHAVEYLPTGATTPTLLGNVHGYEVEDGFVIEVDDVVDTLTDGEIVMADREVKITRTGHLVHPDTGATSIADTTVVYTIGRFGLTVDDTIAWDVAGALTKAYAMMPLNGALSLVTGAVKFNRAALLDYPGGTFTFTGLNGDSYYGDSKSAAAWVWAGDYGVLMHMPDVEGFTNDWENSSNFTRVEDRDGNITKVYIGRSWGTSEDVAAGDEHRHRTTYTVGYFPAGAEASLATL